MTRWCAVARWIVVLGLVLTPWYGCSIGRQDPGTGPARYVEIDKDVSPRTLFARVGEEVRWHNASQHPVRVGILDANWREHVSCEKGFQHFGTIEDVVTIPPQDYVSLCFSRATTVRYNVWLDLQNIKGSMTPTATIRID